MKEKVSREKNIKEKKNSETRLQNQNICLKRRAAENETFCLVYQSLKTLI